MKQKAFKHDALLSYKMEHYEGLIEFFSVKEKAQQPKAETKPTTLSAEERRKVIMERIWRRNAEWLKKNGLRHDGRER